jgi:hypothetical protein
MFSTRYSFGTPIFKPLTLFLIEFKNELFGLFADVESFSS